MHGTIDAEADPSSAVCLPGIGQFFAGMLHAEEISRDVARRQALLAPDAAMHRFFALQSRQEAVHARAFRAALHLASRRDRCPGALRSALDRFAARLHADLDAGSLEASLIGLQGVFEGIGAVALDAPRTELAAIGARFVPLRHVLLRQEAMHHRCGLHWLARLAADRNRDHDALRRSQRDYADLGEAVVVASVDVFEGFDIDQRLYRDAAKAAIAAALGAMLVVLPPACAPAWGQAPGRVTQPTPFSSMAPEGALGPWEPVRLGIGKHPTRYAWIQDGDAVVLHAVADSAASGVAHPVTIDVRRTPLLTWRWKVGSRIPDADVRIASRDDSPARILLGFDGDRAQLTAVERMQHALWGRIIGHEPPYATLAYVWSNDLPVGAVLESPHSRRIRLIAASTGASSLVGAWEVLVRDVDADYRRAFGEAPGTLTSVTVVTDTDDTRSRVEAWYGDIRFEAAPGPTAPPGANAATADAPAAPQPGASGR